MGLIDLLGSTDNFISTRITDKEQTHLNNYKAAYKKKHKEEPSTSKVLRIALMEHLERELEANHTK